jgi:tyrosyl-tRNA synthetase
VEHYSVNTDIKKLIAGTTAVIPLEDFQKKIASGRTLKIKLGIDPTSPDLHLGHAVVLSKLKDFQDAGHEIILLIGDFTGRIGDPTGRSKTRLPLTDEQITHNFKTYIDQVSKILDLSKVTIRYNSEWLGALTSKEWLQLCAKVTLSRIIERDDFKERMQAQQPIGFHELMYPLLQGYDSVALHSDVELGGNDQTFNVLMGRYLQEHFNQEPQVIMTLPLLPGLDGVAKMSKSLGNAIGLTEPADQVYGKLMSMSDTLMWTYYEILLQCSPEEINTMKEAVASGKAHPMELKKALAYAIVQKFWGKKDADEAQVAFEHLFQKKDFDYAQEIALSELAEPGTTILIMDLLKKINAASSSSEMRRLIEAGAVSIDGIKIVDFKAQVLLKPGTPVKVGKHKFYKVV